MGNTFAYFTLFFFPVVAIYLFKTKKIELAILNIFLWGFLLLPVKTSVDLPFFPDFNKETAIVFSAAFGCLLLRKKKIGLFNSFNSSSFILIGLLINPILTTITNTEAIHAGPFLLKGLDYHDGIAALINQLIAILPFYIGSQFFRTYDSQLTIFKCLALAGFIYSILILFEVRFSPQLHAWIYGYFPHAQFVQQIRFGGFRPVGFIGHGLSVAFFIAICFIAIYALSKFQSRIGLIKKPFSYIYMFMILILCKSLAPLAYGLISFISMTFFSEKRVLLISLLIAIVAFSYPLLKITNSLPTETIIGFANELNQDRAGSLQFRLDNEDLLLKKADEKPYFGWGGWGRNRVYDETGKDVSVTDGTWIIQYGSYGAVGFLLLFSLFLIPIFKAYRLRSLMVEKKTLVLMSAHTLMISILMLDQILNASINSLYWLLAGALHGRCLYISNTKYQKAEKPSE